MLDPATAGMDRRDFLSHDIFARQHGRAAFRIIAGRDCRCRRLNRTGAWWLFGPGEVPRTGRRERDICLDRAVRAVSASEHLFRT
jgi:hypothetical protein